VTARRDRDQQGSALVELVWLGLIVLVPLIWIVVSVFEVQRGAYAVSAAARAAGRAYALADDDGSGRAAARAVMARTLADQGVAGMTGSIDVSCSPFPGSCHQASSVVTVRVDSRVALPLMPKILGGGSPSFALDASHTVPIGTYVERSGP
jgi:Flp pilus assembly protein TadG